jgi:Phasin protein
MSKRKNSKNSKDTRKNHSSVRAQLATQAVVRSRTNKRPVAAGATELEPSRESNSPQVSIPENPATALQNQGNQILSQGANFPSMMANVQVYQAKLLEIAQSNLQLAFEFTERLLTLRSPAAFVGLVGEFTSKRTDMFWKYSKELADWVRGSTDEDSRRPEASAVSSGQRSSFFQKLGYLPLLRYHTAAFNNVA